MKKHALLAFLLWAVLTAAGEAVAITWDYFPLGAAEEAEIVDDAFNALVVMSVPVIAFVLAVMIYSVLRFRQRGEQLEDGPPIHSNKRFVITWFTVTSLLTVVLMIFPGTLGLLELQLYGQHGAESSQTKSNICRTAELSRAPFWVRECAKY